MCLLCSQWEKEKMTNQEAMTALGEMLQTEQDEETRNHLFGLANRVLDKEEELYDDGNLIFFDDLDDEDYDCP